MRNSMITKDQRPSLTMAAVHRLAPTASACRNCLSLSQATDDALSALGIALQIIA